MSRLLAGFFCQLTLVLTVNFCGWNQVSRGAGYEALSPGEASRIGMVSAWQRQLGIAGGAEAIVDAKIFVDQSKQKNIVQVEASGRVLLRLSEEQLNANGKPLGLSEVQRLAKLEVYKLARRGIQATVSEIKTPDIRLYVLSSDGTLEARDAETGRVLWTERYGNPRLPTLPMAVNHQVVAFINGKDLLLVDAHDGRLLSTKAFRGVPLYGPAIAGDYVMAVCASRSIEGFNLKDLDADPFRGMAGGLPMSPPIAAPLGDRLVWSTDAGYIYAADGIGRPGLEFRFPADGKVSAAMAYGSGDRFFAATDKGQVYGLLGTKSGRVLWRFSLGDPVYDSPHLIGDKVLFKTVYGEVFCLNAVTGDTVWNNAIREVDEVLGGNAGQLFVRTISGTLRVIDLESASVVADFGRSGHVTAVKNPLTDRLYLITGSGTIQCLRPVGAELPSILFAAAPADSEAAKPEDAAVPDGKSPFGFEDALQPDPNGGNTVDPFGNGGESDPFGGDAVDPFGGDTTIPDDPFGG